MFCKHYNLEQSRNDCRNKKITFSDDVLIVVDVVVAYKKLPIDTCTYDCANKNVILNNDYCFPL